MAVWLKSALIRPLEGDAFFISATSFIGLLFLFKTFAKSLVPGIFLMVFFSVASGITDFAYETRSFFCSTILLNTDIPNFKVNLKVFQYN